MFPTLLQIGPIAISSQGLFLALAFLVGSFLVWRKGREENFDLEPLMDAVFLASAAAFLGARILFVVFQPHKSLALAFNFSKYPGFSYFGALFAGVFLLRFFAHRRKWDFYKLSDVLVFGLLPAHILIRIGNFLDGSFYGRATSLPWGIRFPGLESKVHPLALYEIFFLIGLFFLIRKLERQYRLFEWYRNKRGEALPGFLFLSYLLFYSFFRFLIEFLKDSSLYWYGLGWEQWISMWLLVASLILFYKRSGKKVEDILFPIRKKLQKFLANRRGGKLEVLASAVPKKRERREKRRFSHFKTGMEAKR